MATIKIYSTPSCPWCKKAKAYLGEKGIEFTSIDVSSDEIAQKEMIEKSGQMGVPVLDIDGKIVIGFDKKKIDSLLRIKKNNPKKRIKTIKLQCGFLKRDISKD